MSGRFLRGALAFLLAVVLLCNSLPQTQAASLDAASKVWASRAIFSREFSGQSYALAVDSSEQYAYFSSGSRLYAADIHTQPGHVDSVHGTGPLHGFIQQIVLVGSTAYLAAEDAGMVVMDITYPYNPQEIGAFLTPSDVNHLLIAGSRAYLATEYDGIYILDISNPAHPSQLGHFHPDSALFYNVQVVGSTLYAMSYNNGLYIYSVSDPANATQLGNIAYTGGHGNYFRTLVVNGNYAYAGNINSYLAVFDLGSKTYLSDIQVGNSTIEDLFIAGNSLYLAVGHFGLCQLNISTPSAPSGSCSAQPYDQPDVHRVVAVGSGRTYLATEYGLKILNPDSSVHGWYFDFVSPADAAYANDKIYGVNRFGLTILDANTGISLGSADNAIIPGGGLERITLTTQSNKTYALASSQGSGELYVYDVSDPAVIAKVSGPYTLTEGRPVRLQMIGTTLYVATRSSGYLYIYNAADLAALVYQTRIALAGDTYDLQLSSWTTLGLPGNPGVNHRVAFIAESSAGADVIDVSDPLNPSTKHIAAPAGRSFLGVAAGGGITVFFGPNTIYLSDQSQIYVYDYSSNPSLVTSFSTYGYPAGAPSGLKIVNGYLVSANSRSGVDYYDLSNPQSPTRVGYVDLPAYTYNLVRGKNMQVMAIDDRYGIQLVSLAPNSVYIPTVKR